MRTRYFEIFKLMIKKKKCGYFLLAICSLAVIALSLLLFIPAAADSPSARASYVIYIFVFLLGAVKGIRYIRGYRSFGRPLPLLPEKSVINLGTTKMSKGDYIKITGFEPDRLSLFVVYFIISAVVNLALGYRSLWADVFLPLLFASVFVVLLRGLTLRGYKMLYPVNISAEEGGLRTNGIYMVRWFDIHSISVRGDYLLIERANIYDTPIVVLNRSYVINGEEYTTAELLSGCIDRALADKKHYDGMSRK